MSNNLAIYNRQVMNLEQRRKSRQDRHNWRWAVDDLCASCRKLEARENLDVEYRFIHYLEDSVVEARVYNLEGRFLYLVMFDFELGGWETSDQAMNKDFWALSNQAVENFLKSVYNSGVM